MVSSRIVVAAVYTLAVSSALRAAETTTEQAAEKLIAATVTIRSVAAQPSGTEAAERNAQEPSSEGGSGDKTARSIVPSAGTGEVTVCSGVSLGKGLIVTFLAVPPAEAEMPRCRVTLKAGEQAEASLRVVDRHSGLVLLEIENRRLPGLELSREQPKVGGKVLTACAAGIEEPVVSAGILGATDRTPLGVDLPPLLQCDVRTTETASGAAVVNANGDLEGIVVATPLPGARSGWTYALPKRHVERILAAKADGKLIEIKRRRPVVGFTIGAGEKEGTVLVERVDPRGPAAEAGIRAGDFIAETDGLKIRSAYQAIDQILKKQPGDRMSFSVQRDGRLHTLDVLLDGGAMPLAEIPPSAASTLKIGPQLKARRTGTGEITIRDNHTLREVAVDPERGRTRRSVGNEAELLRLQLGAYERVIERLQQEIDTLRRETGELHDRLKERKK